MSKVPERANLFRVAKVCGIWDADKLEKEIPVCLLKEWNEYLDYELSQMTRAIMEAAPTFASFAGISGGSGGVIKLDKPDDISRLFDGLGATTERIE